jgi:hypothetical protein
MAPALSCPARTFPLSDPSVATSGFHEIHRGTTNSFRPRQQQQIHTVANTSSWNEQQTHEVWRVLRGRFQFLIGLLLICGQVSALGTVVALASIHSADCAC